MSTQKQTVKTPKTKASDMFFLAAIAFILLLAEPMLNTLFSVSGFAKTVATRAVCIVIWAFGAKGLVNLAKKDCNFEIFKKEKSLSPVQWTVISIFAAAVLGYFVWNKFSVLKIIANNSNSFSFFISLMRNIS